MNAPAILKPTAQRYSAVSFEAFRVTDGGKTIALAIDATLPDLAAAMTAALQAQCFYRKEHLLIREIGDDGTSRLHVFAIKQAKPKWVHPAGEIMPRRVEDRYAERLFVFEETGRD